MGTAAIVERDCGASVVDEQLLTSAVNLAHGALEGLGVASVVDAELGVAVGGFTGVLGRVL